MSNPEPLPRSPELMSRHDTALLVVDVQEKLLPAIAGGEQVVFQIRRLIEAAQILGLPVRATEQYPRGLGPTVAPLRDLLGEIPEKLTFSCRECSQSFAGLSEQGVYKILVCGIEAHVCVAQTVLDLMHEGFHPFVAVDAVGSRRPLDCDIAMRRLDSAGATLTTTEAALFEWCERAGTDQFKQITRLVQQEGPEG